MNIAIGINKKIDIFNKVFILKTAVLTIDGFSVRLRLADIGISCFKRLCMHNKNKIIQRQTVFGIGLGLIEFEMFSYSPL